LVGSLSSGAAVGKTFELVAENGPAPEDLDLLFAALESDLLAALDGIRDSNNMPLGDEPQRIRGDLEAVATNPRTAPRSAPARVGGGRARVGPGVPPADAQRRLVAGRAPQR
jgi:hypothetical protein